MKQREQHEESNLCGETRVNYMHVCIVPVTVACLYDTRKRSEVSIPRQNECVCSGFPVSSLLLDRECAENDHLKIKYVSVLQTTTK